MVRLLTKPRLEATVLRSYWIEIHRTKQLRIERVRKKEDLARYFQEQGTRRKVRKKRRDMAYELAKQHGIEAQFESRHWVFPGWAARFRSTYKGPWLNQGDWLPAWEKIMLEEREKFKYA